MLISWIVNHLDTKYGRIDAEIAKQDQIIEKLKTYKTAFLTEVTTHGLNAEVKTKKSSIGWVRNIPEHWSEFRIANLYD